MKIWFFFQPTIHKIIFFFLISLLWIIPTWKDATCKICWEQGHGFPINFIILDSTSGLYPSYWIDSFSAQAFLIDIVVLYLLSCVIFFISYYLYKEKKIPSWPKKHTFKATIQNSGGSGPFVEVPFDVEKVLGVKQSLVHANDRSELTQKAWSNDKRGSGL